MSAARIDIQALLERADLVGIVGKFIDLKKTGSEYQALCPFHTEKTPSFFVISQKGFCYCYGCQWSGDAIDFVRDMTGVSLPEASAIITNEIPVERLGRAAAPLPPMKDIWQAIQPVPTSAPEMDFTNLWNPKRGRASSFRQAEVFTYKDINGARLGYVLRIEFEGGKITPQVTYCTNTDGRQHGLAIGKAVHGGKSAHPLDHRMPARRLTVTSPTGEQRWCLKSMSKPRPIYGLDQLTAHPAAKVLIVEGERCKDVGQTVFGGMAVVSWSGGTAGAKHTHWTPLHGRDCVLWPDNDECGQKAMDEIAAMLAPMAIGLRIVERPGGDKPKGWDIADAILVDKMTPEDVREWAKQRVKTWETPLETDLSLEHFYAYMPSHQYIFAPTGELWPSASVNSRLRPPSGALEKTASAWLDKNRAVSQMTWAPGEPTIIRDRIISGGGWCDHAGSSCFNLYLPPRIQHGDPSKAGRWTDHLRSIYLDSADHIAKWMAHRAQRPKEKINHGLMLGGPPGIGKDTLIEPLKHAVGPWNFNEVTPSHLLGRFNGFVKSVVLRVSEARDLGDFDRFAFYDHTKIYMASPPDVLRCDEKNLREHAVINCCGVIITTNHKTDGIYLPADDRRHYVAWSDLNKEDFSETYWKDFWHWYEHGGLNHVAAYLATLDISSFNPKAPPPKTAAFFEIVDSNRAPEDADLADILEAAGNPQAVTLTVLIDTARSNGRSAFAEWLQERKNRRNIPHRLEAAGYTPVRKDGAEDGLWKISGRRQAAYARIDLSVCDRIQAVTTMIKRLPPL